MTKDKPCGCLKCKGLIAGPVVSAYLLDQVGMKCKWEEVSVVENYWRDYLLFVKRGNTPLINCPIYMKDVADAELQADAVIGRRKREAEQQRDILKSYGLVK